MKNFTVSHINQTACITEKVTLVILAFSDRLLNRTHLKTQNCIELNESVLKCYNSASASCRMGDLYSFNLRHERRSRASFCARAICESDPIERGGEEGGLCRQHRSTFLHLQSSAIRRKNLSGREQVAFFSSFSLPPSCMVSFFLGMGCFREACFRA